MLWNLRPADKRFNSSKCDKLPSMTHHFDQYPDLQLLALKPYWRIAQMTIASAVQAQHAPE